MKETDIEEKGNQTCAVSVQALDGALAVFRVKSWNLRKRFPDLLMVILWMWWYHNIMVSTVFPIPLFSEQRSCMG
jgi:hypothetical protein